MAASKREQIMSAVVSALTGTAGVSTRIYRNRSEPLARNETPALMILSEKDTPMEVVYGQYDWTLDIIISAFVRGNSPESLADPVVKSAFSNLMADRTLGGLALDINMGPTKFDFFEGDMPAGVVSTKYTITYRTSTTSMET